MQEFTQSSRREEQANRKIKNCKQKKYFKISQIVASASMYTQKDATIVEILATLKGTAQC